jgi:hypothetical protein
MTTFLLSAATNILTPFDLNHRRQLKRYGGSIFDKTHYYSVIIRNGTLNLLLNSNFLPFRVTNIIIRVIVSNTKLPLNIIVRFDKDNFFIYPEAKATLPFKIKILKPFKN